MSCTQEQLLYSAAKKLSANDFMKFIVDLSGDSHLIDKKEEKKDDGKNER